jgi:polyphosphate kinase 2 (PPK2 family)
MGYCTLDEYNKFMNDVIPFEEKLIEDDVHLIKIWFSISQETQKLRFKLRQTNPLKSWKLSDNDIKTLNKWNQFSIYKERMFIETSTQKNPWIVVESDNKRVAQLNVLKYILNSIDYEGKDEEVIGKPLPEIIIPMI